MENINTDNFWPFDATQFPIIPDGDDDEILAQQETNESTWVTEAINEEPLSQREKELRDKFVNQYLVDYDYTAAAVRIGFLGIVAVEYGSRFRYDPYVQRAIARSTGSQYDDPESVKKLHRQRVLNGLMKESNYRGMGSSHGARVSALSKLATIHGLEAPTKTESKITHTGEQKVKVTHDFDFASLDTDELGMVRKLLEGRVNGDERKST